MVKIMFTRTDFDHLLAYEGEPAVTLLLPTHKGGRELRQDPIRYRKLVGDAGARLAETGMRRADAERFLERARALVSDEAFWREHADGLAIFIGRDLFEAYKLPFAVPEECIVGCRFHLRHFLPSLEGDRSFYVLALSSRRVRLFEAGRYRMTERRDVKFPKGVEEIIGETDYQKTREAGPALRPRPTATGGSMRSDTFGEDAEALRKTELIEYLSRVADALLPSERMPARPMVLVAIPEIRGQFRALKRLPTLRETGVVENPEVLDEHEMHRRAYGVIAPAFFEERARDRGRFDALFGDGNTRASIAPKEIVGGAGFGRVEALFAAEEVHMWGSMDESSGEMTEHDEPQPGDEELLDFAANKTIRNGGRVYVLPIANAPFAMPMAAIFRY
jgi:hypothetical protein